MFSSVSGIPRRGSSDSTRLQATFSFFSGIVFNGERSRMPLRETSQRIRDNFRRFDFRSGSRVRMPASESTRVESGISRRTERSSIIFPDAVRANPCGSMPMEIEAPGQTCARRAFHSGILLL